MAFAFCQAKKVVDIRLCCSLLHRGAFCQFPFRRIYYYGSNKLTGKEIGKTHLCVLVRFANRRTALAARQLRRAEAQAVAAAMHLQRYAALPQSCMMYFEQ